LTELQHAIALRSAVQSVLCHVVHLTSL